MSGQLRDNEPAVRLQVLNGGRKRYDTPPELRHMVKLVLCLAAVGLATVILGLALLFVAAAQVLFG